MSSQAVEGARAPDFTLPSTAGGELTLSSLRGRIVVLYFYPKDHTSGCTKQAQAFRDANDAMRELGAVILGISRDGLKSHQRFATKHQLDFPLLSDPDRRVHKPYGVMKQKTMYGKQVVGVDRSTFLIDAGGTIRRIWRSVKVAGHADQVLDAVRALASRASAE